ncbi:MAG: periplasmic heavy metal sensor [Acidobacteriota bacterium]
MKRWWLLIALLLSTGINVGILATLLTQHFHKPAAASSSVSPLDGVADVGQRPNLGPLADRLGLRGAARTRFMEMQESFVTGMREQRFHLKQLQAELRSELLSEHPDRDRIEPLTKQLGEAYGSLDRALAENILASRAVLTPEQQMQYLRFVGARLQQLRGDRPAAERPQRERLRPFRRRPG